MLTGLRPIDHGIVGNGWYDRDLAEVHFWKQSNALVQGEKVWDIARRRDPAFTCANLFWWFNMHSSVDWSVTPRPMYKADGRKLPDIYTQPGDLRDHLQEQLGEFPLFQFWGPGASIRSSRWIADASELIWRRHHPTLTLVYLPHLDYALQKLGPAHADVPQAVAEIDGVAGDLIDRLEAQGVRVAVVSEYGIEAVKQALPINQALRREGALQVREEQGLELLDPGGSDAFAVADHQIAHVYVRRPTREVMNRWIRFCREQPGVEAVLDRPAQERAGIAHARAGDLVLVAQAGCWFSYPYWLDLRRAPDFARTVDIHRKPGYDPCELFIDPTIRFPRWTLAWKLLRKRMGFRTLLEVIPLDTGLIRGSHGRIEQPPEHQPLLLTRYDDGMDGAELPVTAVRDVVLAHLFNPEV